MMHLGLKGMRLIRMFFQKRGLATGIYVLCLFCAGTLNAEPAISGMPEITVRELKFYHASLDKPDTSTYSNSSPGNLVIAQGTSDEYGDVTPEDLGISGKTKTSDEYGDVTTEEPLSGEIEIKDPIKPFNVAMYHFNDKVYYWAWKPVSQGYKAVVPEDFRSLFSNFYENIKAPIRIFNNLFQGDARGAGTEFMSLLINSTIGVGGLRNCANECFGIQRDYADFGQTLGKWGFGYGFYLVLPFLGPSSAREGIGAIVDWPMKPTSWIGSEFISPESLGLFIHDRVNYTSFHIGEYEALQEAALDPYVAMRDIFLQYRNNLIQKK